MSKRLLSALVAFCMALTLMPSWALAEEPADESPEADQVQAGEATPAEEDNTEEGSPEEDGISEPEAPPVPEEEAEDSVLELEPVGDLGPIDNDDLFTQLLVDTLEIGYLGYGDNGVAPMAEDYGKDSPKLNLTADEEKFYDFMKGKLEAFAYGRQQDTIIQITASDNIPVSGIGGDSLPRVYSALRKDFPLYFYWAERNGANQRDEDGHISYNQTTGLVTSCTLSFRVDKNYRDGENQYRISTAKLNDANAAIERANGVVTANAGSSDYEKLVAYKEWICDAVTYNDEAAGTGPSVIGEDPWQLIYVFDNDSTTNVVCEGYAKAFQYLCDHSAFTDENLRCYTVTGGIPGPHMWNIVTITTDAESDKVESFLVDVTNCDGDPDDEYNQSVGYPDKLFMAGTSGSVDTTYKFQFDALNSMEYDYNHYQSGQYIYDTTEARDFYPDEILALADHNYEPPTSLEGTVSITGTVKFGQTLNASYDGTEPGTKTWQWLRGGSPITGATGQSYTLAAADVGARISVRVTIESDSKTSAPVGPVEKADGPSAPSAPTLTAGIGSITISNYNPAYEYVYTTGGNPTNTSNWQSVREFTGLTEGRTYSVFARVKETATHNASPASAGTQITTRVTPGAPTVGQFTFTRPVNLVYDGTAKAAAVTSDSHADFFTVKYNGSTTAPVNVGTYTVTVDVAAHGDFTAATLTLGSFTIARATARLSITGSSQVNIGGNAELTAVVEAPLAGEASNVTWRSGSAAATVTAGPSATATVRGVTVTSRAVTITATLPGTNNYTGATATHTIEVTALPAQVLTFAENSVTKEFGDSAFTNAATRTTGDGDVTYASSDETVATVNASTGEVTIAGIGEATITATAAGTANYAETTVSYTLTVTAKRITPTVELTGGPWTYTGRAVEPGVVVKNGPATLAAADYEVGYDHNVNAGTNTAHVTVSPAEGGNYTWTPVVTQFSIAKALVTSAPTASKVHGTVTAGAQTYSVAALVANYAGASYGTLAVVDDNDLLGSTVTIDANGTLSYTLTGTGADGQTATVTIPVSSTNYVDFNLVLTITVKDLPEGAAMDPIAVTRTQNDDGTFTVTITPQDGAEYSFNGSAWGPDNSLTGLLGGMSYSASIRRAAVEDVSLAGPEQHTAPTHLPVAIVPNGGTFRGSQEITLRAVADVMIVYTLDGTAPSYTPAAPVVSVAEGEGEGDGETPEAPQPTINGTVYTGPFTINATTTVKAVWYLLDEEGDVNLSGDIQTATFTRRSSSGGGGGGGGGTVSGGSSATKNPNTGTTSSTPSNPSVSSGRDTTTATPSATVTGGTASANINGSMGQDLVNEAVANNSDTVVIAPSISGSADQTNVTIGSSVISDISSRTEADLKVVTPDAEVTISNRGLSSLASKGGSVVVSTASSGDTIDVSITAGGSAVASVTGGVTVEIPANCTAGTVAMLAKADGTTELIRKSVADASTGTVTVPLDGSASITLVDNSKSFRDVPAGNTFANAVAFVSSREIMNGVSDGVFNPSAPLTRAQLAKVLHNLESNPSAAGANFSDVAGDAWCAEAVQWAAAQGIVTGYADGSFKPNSYITREQLAVMLYRYAGSPAVRSTELSYNDASLVGSYAQTAMAWATQNGVLNGKSGNILDPKGQATRAQAAQMLLNYMNNIG